MITVHYDDQDDGDYNDDDDDDDDDGNLYSSMITASCSSTVSRLCGSKPLFPIHFMKIPQEMKIRLFCRKTSDCQAISLWFRICQTLEILILINNGKL